MRILVTDNRVSFGSVLAGFVLASLVSCSKAQPEGEQIRFLASMQTEATKSIVSGTDIPSTYTMYVSSYFTNLTDPGNSGNYFVARSFKENAGAWVSEPASYWPLGGKLNFLSLASEKDLDVMEDVKWDRDDCNRGLLVDLKEGDCLDSEILYAATEDRSSADGGVSLRFQHSQTWLEFRISVDGDMSGLVRIEGIKVKSVYTGGSLFVSNDPFLMARWDYSGHMYSDVTVAGFPVVSDGSLVTKHILLPPQEQGAVELVYKVRMDASQSWDEAVTRTVVTPAGTKMWNASQKIVYSVGISLKSVTINLVIEPWTGTDTSVIL